MGRTKGGSKSSDSPDSLADSSIVTCGNNGGSVSDEALADHDPEGKGQEGEQGGDDNRLDGHAGFAAVVACEHNREHRGRHGGLDDDHAFELDGHRECPCGEEHHGGDDHQAGDACSCEHIGLPAHFPFLKEVMNGGPDEEKGKWNGAIPKPVDANTDSF